MVITPHPLVGPDLAGTYGFYWSSTVTGTDAITSALLTPACIRATPSMHSTATGLLLVALQNNSIYFDYLIVSRSNLKKLRLSLKNKIV
jgi:hypothetical protein